MNIACLTPIITSFKNKVDEFFCYLGTDPDLYSTLESALTKVMRIRAVRIRNTESKKACLQKK